MGDHARASISERRLTVTARRPSARSAGRPTRGTPPCRRASGAAARGRGDLPADEHEFIDQRSEQAELLSLLRAHARLGGFLETTALPDSLRSRLRAAVGDRSVIRDRIATGGMACVYRADDLRHQRPVAIKVLGTAGDEDGIIRGAPQRFLDEIRVTASLQHVNVMPLFDSGADHGLLYFVMPYVDGETLRHHLRRTGPLPVDEAVRRACAVADALDHAHARGIVHRDLKPENILIRAELRGGVSPVITNRRVLFADTCDGDMPMPHRMARFTTLQRMLWYG